jgi:LysM repeat protein
MRVSARAAAPRRRLPVRILLAAGLLALVATQAAPGWSLVRVVSGDTLWGLARGHHTTVAAIERRNHLHGSLIYAGTSMLLPVSGPITTRSAGTVRESGRPVRYVVRHGDTLDGLTARFHTSAARIRARNHLPADGQIDVGQVLVIRSVAHRSAPGGPTLSALARHARSNTLRVDRTSAPTFAQAWNLVRSTARRLGVPPDLALAVAFQESGLQQREVSPTDAVGIMQIEPYTANWLSAYTGRRIDRFDAASNVYAGTDLLRLLLGEAPRREAIAGYYQGLGSVRAHGEFRETRRYVADVLALAARLR